MNKALLDLLQCFPGSCPLGHKLAAGKFASNYIEKEFGEQQPGIVAEMPLAVYVEADSRSFGVYKNQSFCRSINGTVYVISQAAQRIASK